MRSLFLLFLFLINCACSSLNSRGPSSEDSINIVLDIDYTIVSPLDEPIPGKSVTLASGEHFILNEHVAEFISSLAKDPRVKLHFFSGGKSERNLELLGLLKSKDGDSLLSLAEKVFSFDDLVQVQAEGKFAHRYKKDLSKLGFDLSQTIIIDDIAHFVPEEQSENMLWTGKTYYYFESYDEVINARNNPKYEAAYIPQTKEEWINARNIFSPIKELINDILEDESTIAKSFKDQVLTKRANYLPHYQIPKSNTLNCLKLALEFP